MAEYINKAELFEQYPEFDGLTFADVTTIDIVHCYECRWLNDKGKANCFIREKTGICRTTFFCADGERRTE